MTKEWDYMKALDRLDNDLAAALEYNSVAGREDVAVCVLTIEGEHDGADYHWFVKMYDGTFAYVHGGCDYTGWDCQSNCEMVRGGLAVVPQDERRIFEQMLADGTSVRPFKVQK